MAHKQARKNSSYFPQSEESSKEPSIAREKNNAPVQFIQPISDLSFPSNSSILWDRTQVGKCVAMNSATIIPSVLLAPRTIRTVLGQLAKTVAQPFDLSVAVRHRNQLVGVEKQISSRPYYGTAFVCSDRVDEADCNTCVLTIPVASGPISHADADSSTRNMILNLGKAIRRSREFALKSCMRLRAVGHATGASTSSRDVNSSLSSHNSAWLSGDGHLAGTVRMEAILPNVSFRATPIRPIPLLNTVLAAQLVKPNSAVLDCTPKMGYLTMNATRKLVPLLDTDPAVGQVNIVGLWVKFGSAWGQPLQQGGVEDLLRHPFVWGACVRFAATELIAARALVAPDTFLLTIVLGEQLLFYEITEVSQGGWDGQAPRFSAPGEFLSADFTVDLAVDDGADEASQAILGVFRPVSRPSPPSSSLSHSVDGLPRQLLHSPPSSVIYHHGSVSEASVPSQPSAGDPPSNSMSPRHRASAPAARAMYSEAGSAESGSFLAPRERCPQPMPVPQPSSPAHALRHSDAAPHYYFQSQHADVARSYDPSRQLSAPPRALHGGDTGDRMDHLERAFAVSRDAVEQMRREASQRTELVLTLQAELLESRQYIAELQRRLLAVGGMLPEEGWNRLGRGRQTAEVRREQPNRQSVNSIRSEARSTATTRKQGSEDEDCANTTQEDARPSPAERRASQGEGGGEDEQASAGYASCEEEGYWEQEYEEETYNPQETPLSADFAYDSDFEGDGEGDAEGDDALEEEPSTHAEHPRSAPLSAPTPSVEAILPRQTGAPRKPAPAPVPAPAVRETVPAVPSVVVSSVPLKSASAVHNQGTAGAVKGSTATARATLGLPPVVPSTTSSGLANSMEGSIMSAAPAPKPTGHQDFEDLTFIESDSILRIQARYLTES